MPGVGVLSASVQAVLGGLPEKSALGGVQRKRVEMLTLKLATPMAPVYHMLPLRDDVSFVCHLIARCHRQHECDCIRLMHTHTRVRYAIHLHMFAHTFPMLALHSYSNNFFQLVLQCDRMAKNLEGEKQDDAALGRARLVGKACLHCSIERHIRTSAVQVYEFCMALPLLTLSKSGIRFHKFTVRHISTFRY